MLINRMLALVKRAKLREKAKKPRKTKKRIKFHATHERLASCRGMRMRSEFHADESDLQVGYRQIRLAKFHDDRMNRGFRDDK